MEGSLCRNSHKPNDNPEKVAKATGLSERYVRKTMKEMRTTELCT
jgi:hypothetical protein